MKKARTAKPAKSAKKSAAKTAKKAAKKKVSAKKAVAKKAAKKGSQKKAAGAAAKKALTKKALTKKALTKKASPQKKAVAQVAKKAAPRKATKVAKKSAPAKPASATKKAPTKTAAPLKKAAPVKKASPTKAAAPPKQLTPAPAASSTPAPAAPRIAPLPVASTTPATPDGILAELARLLLDEPEFHDEVRLAVEHPEEYVERFADDLRLRGIEAPIPALPWIALTDGLQRQDALIMLDWTFEPDELLEGLASILAKRGVRDVDLGARDGYSEGTEALQLLGDRLQETGLALVTIDSAEPEDAFPVAVIDADVVDQAASLAAQLGLGSIQRWSSDDEAS